MPDIVKCPFCNYETPFPTRDKVFECMGECYSTYTLAGVNDDRVRMKMRLIEVFFLDHGDTPMIAPDEIDAKCEFKTIPARVADEIIVFSRQKRVEEHEIDKLRNADEIELEIGVDTLERLRSALDRFERDANDGTAPKENLINEIKLVETIARVIREKLELSL
jgi:hypothetical protein